MILILGVTASGKGRLAFELAKHRDAEIISVDSMKVYRRMDIGTAKPPKQACEQIKHHLIDIIEPSDSFSVAAFYENALDAIEQIKARGKSIIAVGGTALYIKALLYGIFQGPSADEKIRTQLKLRAETEGLAELHCELETIDPTTASRISPNDARRIIRALEVYKITGKPISSFQQQWDTHSTYNEKPATKQNWTIIGLRREKNLENKRINTRAQKMISAGLVDEVRALLSEEKPLSKQARCAIGYSEIIEHLSGRISLEDAVELIKKNTRRFAKSQRTWFKTFKGINWLDIQLDELLENILKRAIELIS